VEPTPSSAASAQRDGRADSEAPPYPSAHPSALGDVLHDRRRAREILFRILMQRWNGGEFPARGVEYDELLERLGAPSVKALEASFHVAYRNRRDGSSLITLGDHELRLHADDSIDCWLDTLVPPTRERPRSALDTLDAHLEEIAPSVPKLSEGTELMAADGALRIEAEADVRCVLLLVVLNRCALRGIRSFELAVGNDPPIPIETSSCPAAASDSPLLVISPRKPETQAGQPESSSVTCILRWANGDRAQLKRQLETMDLETFGLELRRLRSETRDGVPLIVEASPKLLCSDVSAAIAVACSSGFGRIVFALAGE